jgi:hypothetical protein
MQRKTVIFVLGIWTTLLMLAGPTHAVNVKGFDIADQVTVDGNNLVLNGTGLRTKFVFDIYVGALYLGGKTNSAQAVLSDTGAQQVSMYFIHDEISSEKMRGSWTEGFANVLDAAGLKNLQTPIETFTQAFGDTKAGDVITVSYSPAKGTSVIINNTNRVTVPGAELHQAIMKVWFGDDPVDATLKQGMLGKSE